MTSGAADADILVIEGNHGLYDSAVDGGHSSSAALARTTRTPILLVLSAARMGRSAAALVHGFQTFEPDVPLAGVILNQVAGSGGGRHASQVRQAIEEHCGIPVLGVMTRDERLTIPDRHLGLVPQGEDESLVPAIAACRRAVEAGIDLEAVIGLARSASALSVTTQGHAPGEVQPPVLVGVLRDRAFSFYYPENLEALERAGAQLEFIDSMNTTSLPPISGLYIGGGFPEMFMAEIVANGELIHALRTRIAAGLPVYAECGGLMYLCRRLHWGDRQVEMVGALPYEVNMTDAPQGHGYVIAQTAGQDPFFPVGTTLRGHEFHHSLVTGLPSDIITAYRLERGRGLGGGRDGLLAGNVLAAYLHLHADGAPGWAPAVVNWAREYARVK